MKASRYEDKQYWLTLAERYFEAETTDQEEAELVRFLASPFAQGVEFDELRAVMGYFSVGKEEYAKPRTVFSWRKYGRLAAAVIAGLLMMTWGGYEFNRQQNLCVAYVYGERFTDPNRVLSEMETSLKNLQYEEVEETVDHQLSSIFQTLSDTNE